MKKQTYITMTGQELDTLIRQRLAPLTNNPGRYTDWESVAEFEWNNYACYEIEIEPTEPQDDYYLKHSKPEIMKGEELEIFSQYQIFTFMVEHGILEAGNYLIDPSW